MVPYLQGRGRGVEKTLGTRVIFISIRKIAYIFRDTLNRSVEALPTTNTPSRFISACYIWE